MLTVAMLGTVEVRRDGELLKVPAGKTTELLLRLALETGARVRTDALRDCLWTEPAGRNTLQSKVSQLRRAVGDRGAVLSFPDGYALAVERGSVDALQAVDLASEAAVAWQAADAVTTLDRASKGAALFTGDVLVDAGDWAAGDRGRLEEVRISLLELMMGARVALGAGGEVVDRLEELVEQHPLRESLWLALMTALYRAGRQADALATYERVRAILIAELGIDPGLELQALEQQVLRQSPALTSPPHRSMAAMPENLPDAGTELVGRTADMGAVSSLLRDHRIVTIVGTAGVGKTRLARELAEGLVAPGGVWLIRLDEADESKDLLEMVAEVLHLVAGRSALLERLAGAETVLVLDNCEHLVGGVGVLARSLLQAAPRLHILATSQVALGIEGETVHHLEPLSPEDSVTLFSSRARTMRRRLVLGPTAISLIEEICRSLDGLPLAIELAAARARSMSIEDIARRLEDRFALLHDPTSHLPARNRALSSAIAWSYDLLFPDDQRGLWAMSRFAGSATLDATEHVLRALGVPPSAVLDTVTRLVDRSLVTIDVADDGSVRYRLLDSIRAYAADRLREAGVELVAAAACAAWYADTAAWCDANVRGPRQPECLRFARAERANVDAVLAWCAARDEELGVRIANCLGWTWVVLGDGTTGAARIRGALGRLTPPRERATGLLLAGWLEASAGNVVVAQSDLDAAFAIAEELDDDRLRADAQRHLAFLSLQQGHPQSALSYSTASLAVYRSLGLQWQAAGSLLLAAFGAIMLGDTTTGTADASEARAILTTLGDSWGLVHAEAMLGAVAHAEHRLNDAAVALTRAAELSQELGFLGQAALHLATLGRVQQRNGATVQAVETFAKAISAAEVGGDGRLAATARLHLARIRRADGDGGAALQLLHANERWYEAAGGGDGDLLNRCLLHAHTCDTKALTALLEEAKAATNTEVRVYALDALARIAATAGDPGRAEEFLSEADAMAATVTHLVDDADRLDGTEARVLLGTARAV